MDESIDLVGFAVLRFETLLSRGEVAQTIALVTYQGSAVQMFNQPLETPILRYLLPSATSRWKLPRVGLPHEGFQDSAILDHPCH